MKLSMIKTTFASNTLCNDKKESKIVNNSAVVIKLSPTYDEPYKNQTSWLNCNT